MRQWQRHSTAQHSTGREQAQAELVEEAEVEAKAEAEAEAVTASAHVQTYKTR